MKSFIQSEEELQRGGESKMLADPPFLDNAGLFHYESITLSNWYYPQTILAYELNGAPLDVFHAWRPAPSPFRAAPQV